MSRDKPSGRQLFDLDLLRAIVVVADCGSFTTAAGRLHSTQSTVSQKILRLEELAGHRLLDRGNRGVRPTDAGETLLGYARHMLALNDALQEALAGAAVTVAVRLGVPEDFVGGQTTRVLASFATKYPHVKLEVTSGLCRDIGESYDRGELDLALVKYRRGSGQAVARWPEALRWIDSVRNPSAMLDPLPLVVFPPRGLYRDDMINAIERMGRRWRISFTTSSLSGVQAAVADGLGISILPARAVTTEHHVLDGRRGFPRIDTMDLALLHRPGADAMVRDLATALSSMLETERHRKQ